MRKIALDVGDVRIGIATSDPMGIIASGYQTYTRTKDIDVDMQFFAKLAKDSACDTFVLGLPLNMDSTEGPRVVKTREFADKLAQFTDIKIAYQDERWSTVSAEKMLINSGVRRENRKKVIDKVAATIILQSYLDRIH
ncbi:MAG: Holliday junction resolvase RuvX [Clostridia bacterium]